MIGRVRRRFGPARCKHLTRMALGAGSVQSSAGSESTQSGQRLANDGWHVICSP
jgi:hypothetical protein